MSAIAKTKLKAAREAIAKKDYEKARDVAQQALEYDPGNYFAYVHWKFGGRRRSIHTPSEGMCFSALHIKT